MIIGVKGLTYALLSSGGDGSAPVYSNGETLEDMMVNVDYSPDRDEGGFNADDHMIDRVSSINSVTVDIEVAKVPLEMRAKMLGWAVNTGGTEYTETSGDAPYVGVGFVYGDRYKGVDTYLPIWIYKTQFSLESDNAATKGETIDFQTRTLHGTSMGVQLDNTGVTSFRVIGATANTDGFTTYAAALAWLKGKAGIQG